MPLDIETLYILLEEAYGDLGWWPADGPFEVAVGAILTQRTSWRNAERSLVVLKKEGLMDPERLAGADPTELEQMIRHSGFYRQKARYLLEFSRHVRDAWSGDMSAMAGRPKEGVRLGLLALPGIGPETADSILLYALDMPSFVVDAYTFRLLDRLGVGCTGGYEGVKDAFEHALGLDVARLGKAHALIVEHSKRHCRAVPRCDGCPLAGCCPSEAEQREEDVPDYDREHETG